MVGSGELGSEGVGGPATAAQLQTPVDLAFDRTGSLYIAERFGARILRVKRGVLTVVAGTGESGFSGDGGPASEAKLNGASAVAVGPDGKLYIADGFNNRIRMVNRRGVISTIAGTGDSAFSGDGGPAVEASLFGPAGMVVDPDGNLYVADVLNHRIRRIDRDGTITSVAGTGELGFSPDGTRATKTSLGDVSDHVPAGMAFDAAGRLHYTDLGNNRIRMIDSRGLVRTVAGDGEEDSSGDGGRATKAALSQPLDIAIGPDGTLYIATHDHGWGSGQRIRSVTRDGIIMTVAGTGASDYTGDGGPATRAQLNIPSSVAIGPDGNLYIADAVNNVVRMVVL
ncbi:MAG: hypothetical protein ACRDN6_00735 [Gaiellaceae bacterium]